MLSELSWDPPPPLGPGLDRDEVHAWRIELDQPDAVVERLSATLDPDELRRADRFYSSTHRARFIVGRGSLRAILSRYLGIEPVAVAFRYGDRGKPELEGAEPLRFNLAHSGGLAVLAVATGRTVGVDVEQVRPMQDFERIVERFFSPAERSAFFALPEGRRAEAFFRGWTCKEAYMKATGEGFALPLDRFDVSLDEDEPPRLLRVAGRPGEEGRWGYRVFRPTPESRAALAVEGEGWRLVGYQYDPAALTRSGGPRSD
jgi:4'-phosphopantetheinyl transferase